MKVLLDTNFLIDLVRFKVDLNEIDSLILESYKLATLESVINELEKISSKKSKLGDYAKLTLKLLDEYKFEILPVKKRVDKAILELAKKDEIIIATNDSELRKQLKALGRKTIYLKSKKHLAIG